jgi:hypothetical protein
LDSFRDLLEAIYGSEAERATIQTAVFGEGNVEESFKNFPSQHKCNHFCHWLKLAALQDQN